MLCFKQIATRRIFNDAKAVGSLKRRLYKKFYFSVGISEKEFFYGCLAFGFGYIFTLISHIIDINMFTI
jgi:hypothetical protein